MAKNVLEFASESVRSLLQKVLDKFHVTQETRERAKKCENELSAFAKLTEDSVSKVTKGIPVEKLESVVESWQNRYNLPDKMKAAALEILHCDENDEFINSFYFQDGEGYVRQGYIIMRKHQGKIDVAFVYHWLEFKFEDVRWVHTNTRSYLFGLFQTTEEVVVREKRAIDVQGQDMLKQLCLVRLHDKLKNECGGEDGEVVQTADFPRSINDIEPDKVYLK